MSHRRVMEHKVRKSQPYRLHLPQCLESCPTFMHALRDAPRSSFTLRRPRQDKQLTICGKLFFPFTHQPVHEKLGVRTMIAVMAPSPFITLELMGDSVLLFPSETQIERITSLDPHKTWICKDENGSIIFRCDDGNHRETAGQIACFRKSVLRLLYPLHGA